MREKIIELVFDGWCDGLCGLKRKEGEQVQEAIDNIVSHFNGGLKDSIYVEGQWTELICTREKDAFIDGFYMCLELLNGNVMKGV